MWIMNVVWPVVALFGTILTLWAYFQYGRLATHAKAKEARQRGENLPSQKLTPYPVMVGKAAAHCGSGCCLGDICAEWLAFAVPGIAVALGWGSLFGEKTYAVWILDFIFAFVLGIIFQYFTIKPMRNLYAFMAFAQFFVFRHDLHARLEVNSAEFWFMMQIAMLCGFATSYPVNWWLLRAGIKEAM
jgi:branched-subunit amino acid transport protein